MSTIFDTNNGQNKGIEAITALLNEGPKRDGAVYVAAGTAGGLCIRLEVDGVDYGIAFLNEEVVGGTHWSINKSANHPDGESFLNMRGMGPKASYELVAQWVRDTL